MSTVLTPRRRLLQYSIVLLAVGVAGCAGWQAPGESLGVRARAGGGTFDVGGGRSIYLEDRGHDGRTPVLLLHGFASNREVWDSIEPELRRTRRTINVDLPGFGGSSRTPGDYSPVAIAADLTRVLDQLGAQTVDIVAHSWGSAIALALALAAPERVRRLVLVGAWCFDEQVPPFLRWAWAGGVGEALFTTFYRERPEDRFPLAFEDPGLVSPKMVEAIRRSFERPGTTRAALAAVRGMRFLQLERRYHQVVQPTLLLWGRNDRVARPRFGEELAKRLPDARLITFPRVGHFPMLESPGRTRRAIVKFLAAQSRPPRPSQGGGR